MSNRQLGAEVELGTGRAMLDGDAAFKSLLKASNNFLDLNANVRADPVPDLSIADLERLADQLAVSMVGGRWDECVEIMMSGSVHYSNTGFLKQQLNAPLSGSAIGALWAAILNQGQAVFEMSPLTSVLEARMLEWTKQRLRLSRTAFGLSTGGGTLANLSALLAARNRLDNWGRWTKGTAELRIRVLCSDAAHYSVTRAVSILGIGNNAVVTVATSTDGRIDIDALLDQLENDVPTIVVLNAGTTFSGAFDDIVDFFARYRRSERVWVHIDACHGGSFYDTPALTRHFACFAYAESVCWDLHKAYFQSTPLSFLFFQRRELANYTSNHSITYLSQDDQCRYPDMNRWTLECSRTANALKLWVSLHVTGETAIVEMVAKLHDSAVMFEAGLSEHFETTGTPDTNIVAFRPRDPCTDARVHQLVHTLQNQYGLILGTIEWQGRLYARACFMNPRVTDADVAAMINIALSIDAGRAEAEASKKDVSQ